MSGIEFEWQGQVHRIQANSEVVLSAGTFQTPKLLMLSGIGDSKQMARFDIPTVAHLPGVGHNLQDHPIIGGGLWEPNEPVQARNNAAEANLFVKSRADLHTGATSGVGSSPAAPLQYQSLGDRLPSPAKALRRSNWRIVIVIVSGRMEAPWLAQGSTATAADSDIRGR